MAKAKKKPVDPNYIAPPSPLSGSIARRWWDWLIPKLKDRLSILEIDHTTVMAFCDAQQFLHDCRKTLKKSGRYITMPGTGYVSRHPAALDEARAVSQIRMLEDRLGMNPKSRRGVKTRSAEGDPLKAFLDGKPVGKRKRG